jgi:hypothetical protein
MKALPSPGQNQVRKNNLVFQSRGFQMCVSKHLAASVFWYASCFCKYTKAARDLFMSEKLQKLIEAYHVFYEVSPYHVVIEEKHGSPAATRRIIQAGFNVDVHGLSNKIEWELPPPAEYAIACAEVRKVAEAIPHRSSECSIEVIPFPATVVSEARRNFQSEAVLRIQISRLGPVDQRADMPEQHALEEIEKQLQGLGMARR